MCENGKYNILLTTGGRSNSCRKGNRPNQGREQRELKAKELPLRKTEKLLMAWAVLLTSFPFKSASFTSCMLSKLNGSWKWKKKTLSFSSKQEHLSKMPVG